MHRFRLFLVGIAALVVALAGIAATAQARTSSQAVCKSFLHFDGPQLRNEKYERVDHKVAALELEGWINARFSEGRTQLQSVTVYENGAVLCAW